MPKTIDEINEKIRKGHAVVVTAEEVVGMAKAKGVAKTASEVDVVTTGTFGPMCGSGMYLNTGHTKPRIKLGGGKVYLNDVLAYPGMAAVDIFLGATAMPDDEDVQTVYTPVNSIMAVVMLSRNWWPDMISGLLHRRMALTVIPEKNWKRSLI